MQNPSDTGSEAQRERLRSAYRSFWENAVVLSNEIQRDAPNLTLHNEAHFDALWIAADQIAGKDLTLTPLETFVLGGAILLHDNANSLAAFPGGIDVLKKTPEWRDAVSEKIANSSENSLNEDLTPEQLSAVLFDVLRNLHAERAKTLSALSVTQNGRTFHLIQDDQLRTHLGEIMGLVAASHHWDIATLSSRLPSIRGALGGMPQTWSLRPILLACLLRCADATQLDQQRAPDFLYAMLRLRGVSESHWRAQNRLSSPVIAPDDTQAIIFSSTTPFEPNDADAWWIAHDAIQVANRELQSANALLRDKRLPPFAVNRVEGAISPTELSRHVTVQGWRPVQAEIKISQIGKVVEMFGGEELYGHDPSVALRELIQNAADAVRFRRELEPRESEYHGRITVRLKSHESINDTYWLDVEDDGIGMSEAVLTGPLIDFGSSYISSSIVKSEYPGLLSKGNKRLGRYGIGFFSCFMLSDEVLVTSRKFDDGKDLIRTLHFSNGLGHRPLLLDDQPTSFGGIVSTRVRLKLSSDDLERLLKYPIRSTIKINKVDLSTLIGILCPMLDVTVHVDTHGESKIIHREDWYNEDRLTWLRRITAADIRNEKSFDDNLIIAAPLLRFLDTDKPSLGLACITGFPSSGVQTVSTLRAGSRFSNDFSDNFTGAIDHESSGPRRNALSIKSRDLIKNWATQQARIVLGAGIKLPKKLYVARHIANFGGDSSEIAEILLNKEWKDIPGLFEHLKNTGAIYAPVTGTPHNSDRFYITEARENHTGFIDNYHPDEIEYLIPTIHADASTTVLYDIPFGNNLAETGILNLLSNYAKNKGYRLNIEAEGMIDFAKYIGQSSPRQNLDNGKIISCYGIKINLDALHTTH